MNVVPVLATIGYPVTGLITASATHLYGRRYQRATTSQAEAETAKAQAEAVQSEAEAAKAKAETALAEADRWKSQIDALVATNAALGATNEAQSREISRLTDRVGELEKGREDDRVQCQLDLTKMKSDLTTEYDKRLKDINERHERDRVELIKVRDEQIVFLTARLDEVKRDLDIALGRQHPTQGGRRERKSEDTGHE